MSRGLLRRLVPTPVRFWLGSIRQTLRALGQWPWYIRSFRAYRALAKAAGRPLPNPWVAYPCLLDRTSQTGFDRHYTYHPAWAARVLARTRPDKHIDISSTVVFAAMASAFVPVAFYDYRPADIHLSNLETGAADVLALPFADGSVRSLSCMHVLEHIGLGRYGDPLDPDGDRKAIQELIRVLAPGGDLLIVLPCGKPGVFFNAHRAYDFASVPALFAPLTLVESAALLDHEDGRGLIAAPPPALIAQQDNGLGCFWFRKAA